MIMIISGKKHTPDNNATRGYSWEFLIFALKIGFRALGLIRGGGGEGGGGVQNGNKMV